MKSTNNNKIIFKKYSVIELTDLSLVKIKGGSEQENNFLSVMSMSDITGLSNTTTSGPLCTHHTG